MSHEPPDPFYDQRTELIASLQQELAAERDARETDRIRYAECFNALQVERDARRVVEDSVTFEAESAVKAIIALGEEIKRSDRLLEFAINIQIRCRRGDVLLPSVIGKMADEAIERANK